MVAKGCSQRPGVDYNETSSPVARSTSIRMVSALSAEYDLIIHQMDVVTAYLNGSVEEEIDMDFPDHLLVFLRKVVNKDPVGLKREVISSTLLETARNWLNALENTTNPVCLLKKALYGLKQAGVRWYKRLVDELLKLGLRSTGYDPCLFHKSQEDSLILVTIYVDDILIASNDQNWIKEVKIHLSKVFRMKDMGPVKHCLGVEFNQDVESHSVVLTQRNYVNSLLNRFNMTQCKPATTPMESGCKLVRPDHADYKIMNVFPYQQLIGGLLYLAVTTRPDIAFVTSFLSQFNPQL